MAGGRMKCEVGAHTDTCTRLTCVFFLLFAVSSLRDSILWTRVDGHLVVVPNGGVLQQARFDVDSLGYVPLRMRPWLRCLHVE